MKYLSLPCFILLMVALFAASCLSSNNKAINTSMESPAPAVDAIANFKINFEREGEGTKLTCTSGCSWKTLNFTQPSYGVQYVYNDGMVDNDEVTNIVKSGFLIKLTDAGTSMKVEGMIGTRFNELTFACNDNCNIVLSEDGVVME